MGRTSIGVLVLMREAEAVADLMQRGVEEIFPGVGLPEVHGTRALRDGGAVALSYSELL